MFKNLKIGSKLIVSFIIVAIIASISGIVSMFVISTTNTDYSNALVNYGFSQGDIGKAMLTVSNSHRCARDIIGFTNQEDIDKAKAEMEDNTKKYATYLEAVNKALVTDTEKKQFETIKTAFQAYSTKRSEAIEYGDTTDATKSRQAQDMLIDQVDPLYDTLYSEWTALMDMNVNTGSTISDDLSKQGNISLFTNIILTVAALIISLILGTIISRGISRPISKCADRLELLAEGDLQAPVPEIDAKDETGQLADATKKIVEGMKTIIGDEDYLLSEMANGNFNVTSKATESYIGDFHSLLLSVRNINSSLSDTLSQINQSAEQVSSGSEQVSSGAQALSQGATEQASSIEELSATIEEISEQIKQNATNASLAREQSQQAGNAVMKSNEQMQNMISAMNNISEKSSEISKIIKTIDDIAFQTNILALNAAVEAARAGAAGKGFAVVADEVRNLASKSAEAAKDTSALIEESILAVENGTKMADETATAMLTVVEGTTEVTQLIEKIASASNEQANAAGQITLGVEQISSVVQTNSATAEESAAASEELSGQAQMLKDLVNKFSLKDSGNTYHTPAHTEAKEDHFSLDFGDKY